MLAAVSSGFILALGTVPPKDWYCYTLMSQKKHSWLWSSVINVVGLGYRRLYCVLATPASKIDTWHTYVKETHLRTSAWKVKLAGDLCPGVWSWAGSGNVEKKKYIVTCQGKQIYVSTLVIYFMYFFQRQPACKNARDKTKPSVLFHK